MGKKRGEKLKVLETYTISGSRPAPNPDAEEEKKIAVPISKKKVLFQLRCTESADAGVAPHIEPPTPQVLVTPIEENENGPTDSNSGIVSQEEQSTSQSLVTPINAVTDHNDEPMEEDPNDLTRYGIYFTDGYNYNQHLRDTTNSQWSEKSLDMYTIKESKSQGKSKRESKMLATIPEPTEVSYQNETIPFQELGFEPGEEEKKFDAMFADADGELSDDMMVMLNAGGDSDEEDYYEEYECPEGVDYSQMPPLEDEVNCRFNNGMEDNDEADSIVSGNCSMNVSDDGGEQSDDEGEQSNSAVTYDNEMIQKLSSNIRRDCVPQPPPPGDLDKFLSGVHRDYVAPPSATTGDLDKFFDSVAMQSDDEDDNSRQLTNTRTVPSMESSKSVKRSTRGIEMINEKFSTMMGRHFKDSDIGGDLMDEVCGNLTEDAPQFRSALDHMSVRPRDEIVNMLTPEQGSIEDQNTKRIALQFSKNWQETKDELIEVTVSDPRSMKYNIGNLPTIKNKNMPSVIRPGILFKKKKGISIKDLKQHDLEMNTPHRDVEEEAQTYKTIMTELSYRPTDESSADRLERKTAVRELRKGRREQKKMNKIAHKDIMANTIAVRMNAKHSKNVSLI